MRVHNMLTLKILHYTDLHLREGNPPSRLGNYREDVLGKLNQIIDIAIEREVDITHCGGDLFDNKNPDATKHKTIIAATNIYNKAPIRHYITPGNHDLQGDNMESLEKQPLGVLLTAGVLRQVTWSPYIKTVGGESLKVVMEAHDFEEEPELSEFTCNRESEEADVRILGLHIYSSPSGGSLWGNTKVFSYKELSQTKHDIYLLGHYHADNGIVSNEAGQTFVNVGSVTRGDYGDENLVRKPKVALITITKDDQGHVTWESEEIFLKVKTPEEAFDLEQKERLKETKKQTESYVEQLQAVSQVVDTTASTEEKIGQLAVDDLEIRDAVLELLREAEEELASIRGGRS